jgi:hypothetical protein
MRHNLQLNLPYYLDNVLDGHEDPGEVSVSPLLPAQLLCEGGPGMHLSHHGTGDQSDQPDQPAMFG